jgi:hypothetical protein
MKNVLIYHMLLHNKPKNTVNDKNEYPLHVLILLPQSYEPCATADELRGVYM